MIKLRTSTGDLWVLASAIIAIGASNSPTTPDQSHVWLNNIRDPFAVLDTPEEIISVWKHAEI